MSDSSKKRSMPTRQAPWWFGALFVGAGLAIVGVAIDWVPSDPDSFQAPRWIVALAGLVCLLAGSMVWANLYCPGWVNEALAVVLIATMGTMAAWVALGPGPREFATSLGLGGASVAGASDTSGRVAFGVAALVLWALEALAVRRLVGALRRRSPAS